MKLYAGLGAYHIGEGDAQPAPQEEWQSGGALAAMAAALQAGEGFEGFALFRYASLFGPGPHAGLAQKENAALRAALEAM